MFNVNQIISATKLIKHFKIISRYLYDNPQPILITQKSQEHLVLVPAEIFQDLLEFKLAAQGRAVQPSYLRDLIGHG